MNDRDRRLLREAASFGYQLHHVQAARREAEERGHAEMVAEYEELEQALRVERAGVHDALTLTDEGVLEGVDPSDGNGQEG